MKRMADQTPLGLGVKRCKLSLKGHRTLSSFSTFMKQEFLSDISKGHRNFSNSSPFIKKECSSDISKGHRNFSNSSPIVKNEYSDTSEGYQNCSDVSPIIKKECSSDIYKINSQSTPVPKNSHFEDVLKEEITEYQRVQALPNIGNTCFMNSVLHVLRITPDFIPWLHRSVIFSITETSNHSVLVKLHKIYHTLMELEERLLPFEVKQELEVQLRSLLDMFASQNQQFSSGQQFDAHEFLCWLVASFCGRHHKGKRSTKTCFVASVIQGKAKTVVICNECETSTAQEDSFWDLKVPLSSVNESEEKATVRERFNANTVLCGEDKYYCTKCFQLTEARHSLRILDLPAVLVVHIPSKCSRKNAPLKIAETLPCIKSSCQDDCCDESHSFRLFALLIHIGSSAKFGHYVTLMRQPRGVTTKISMRTRVPTRSRKMIWEECCQTSGFEFVEDKWLLCDDDKVVVLDNVADYFKTRPLSSAVQPSVLWYHRLR